MSFVFFGMVLVLMSELYLKYVSVIIEKCLLVSWFYLKLEIVYDCFVVVLE